MGLTRTPTPLFCFLQGQPAQDGLHSFGIKPTIYAADIMNLAMSMYFKRAVETKLALDDNDKLKEFAFIPAPVSLAVGLRVLVSRYIDWPSIIISTVSQGSATNCQHACSSF